MPRAVLPRRAACPRAVWVAASALLHAMPLALRAQAPSMKVLALAPSLLEIVAEPESAAAGPTPSVSELPGAAAVAPELARPKRERAPLARQALAPARAEPARETPAPKPAPEAAASDAAAAQPAGVTELPVDAPSAPAAADSSASSGAVIGDALAAGGQRTIAGGNAPGLGAAGTSPASAGEELRTLRQRYLRELRQRVLERREYPHAAVRAGLQGVVCLRLSVTASGYLSELRATCGPTPEPLLQAALRAVRAAEPFRPLPSALGSRLTVDLPVVFQLDAR